MARNEQSAGGGAGSDSTAQTGIEASTLAYGSEGDRIVHRLPSELAVRQAAHILERLCSLAETLHELGEEVIQSDAGQHVHLGQAVAALASQAGWLADLGAAKLGGLQMHGDPERWMLPPLYHDQARVNGTGVNHG
jgi:hypothetical protein